MEVALTIVASVATASGVCPVCMAAIMSRLQEILGVSFLAWFFTCSEPWGAHAVSPLHRMCAQSMRPLCPSMLSSAPQRLDCLALHLPRQNECEALLAVAFMLDTATLVALPSMMNY